jgi:RHS repeat-associated protein
LISFVRFFQARVFLAVWWAWPLLASAEVSPTAPRSQTMADPQKQQVRGFLLLEPHRAKLSKNEQDLKKTPDVIDCLVQCLVDAPNSFFIFTDHLGTPFAWVKVSTGEVTFTPYSPWGELLAQDPTRGPPAFSEGNIPASGISLPDFGDFPGKLPPLGLAGHLIEQDTGLVVMHHRTYHPRLGHFLTPDFRPPSIDDPSTFTEPYAYATGNPVMYWDEDGLQTRHEIAFRHYEEAILNSETEAERVKAIAEFHAFNEGNATGAMIAAPISFAAFTGSSVAVVKEIASTLWEEVTGIPDPTAVKSLLKNAPKSVSKFLDLAKSLKSRAFSWGQRVVGVNPKINLLDALEDPVFFSGSSKGYGSNRGPITDPNRLLSGTTLGQENALRGIAFQQSVHDALRLPENTAKVAGRTRSGQIINTEPDLLGLRSGVTDVKDVVNISYKKQLQAQVDFSIQSGQSFNLVISPRTATVSRPMQRIVRARGGIIVQYDPVTNGFSNVIFQGNRVIR